MKIDTPTKHRVKKMVKKRKCWCCKGKFVMLANQKLCSNCSVYSRDLRNKLYGYKSQLKKCRKRLYGVESGSERIRG